MRRDRPWFGPLPAWGRAFCPLTWEGWAVTLAFLLGMGLLKIEPDPMRRALATSFVVIAFGAVVSLTWGDPETGQRFSWRTALSVGQLLPFLLFLAVFAAACVAAGFAKAI